MSVMSSTKLSAQIRSIKGNKLKEQIQEVLISCSYYAYKDGNVNPFNQLLQAVEANKINLKGVTMWAELNACVTVKEGKFALNKQMRKEVPVTDEVSFAQLEQSMRDATKWYELTAPQKATSIFDASVYLSSVIAKLEKEGVADVVPYITNALEEYNKMVAIKELALADLGEAPL